MGGKRSGASRKRTTLPKKFSEGALSRADRRGTAVRYVREGAQQILEDRGGADHASLLMRRAAHRVMHLDQLIASQELRMAQGQPVEVNEYLASCATWLRYAQAIGLTRTARRATLAQELQQHGGAT